MYWRFLRNVIGLANVTPSSIRTRIQTVSGHRYGIIRRRRIEVIVPSEIRKSLEHRATDIFTKQIVVHVYAEGLLVPISGLGEYCTISFIASNVPMVNPSSCCLKQSKKFYILWILFSGFCVFIYIIRYKNSIDSLERHTPKGKSYTLMFQFLIIAITFPPRNISQLATSGHIFILRP